MQSAYLVALSIGLSFLWLNNHSAKLVSPSNDTLLNGQNLLLGKHYLFLFDAISVYYRFFSLLFYSFTLN